MNSPPFAVFREVLLQLGFVQHSVPGRYHWFDHRDSGTWILLPHHAPDDRVPHYHVGGVRFLLDFRGLKLGEDFDSALREQSLVSGGSGRD